MSDCKVLLVDDEPEFLRTLTKRLGKRDLEVRGAPGGKEALRALAEQEADVVVLDVKMPGMDGIETLRRIKQDHPLVEVIMLTGHADVEAAVQGMEMGAFDYLMKPMDIDELLYKVQDAHKKKLLQEDKIREKQESLG